MTRQAAWLVPVTVAAAAAGFATGHRALYPLLAMAPAFPTMVAQLAARRRGSAIGLMLVWAATTAVVAVALCLAFPARAAAAVWNGPAYSQEMFDWLATGVGIESDPSRFLPQHGLHLAAYAALALATAGFAALLFGTLLLHYMAFYVARVISAADGSPLAVAMAWHPWSLLRIVGFVILGVVLAEPLLRVLAGKGRGMQGAGGWLALAGGLLVLDAALKAVLAPSWRIWLHGLTTGSEGFVGATGGPGW